MEAAIVPEPPEREQEAILAALREPEGRLELPPAYSSPWRLAGLGPGAEPGAEEAEPWAAL